MCHTQELGSHIQGQGHNQRSEVKYFLCDYLKLAEGQGHTEKQNKMTTYVLCKTGSLSVFKVTARDQGHYKGPLGSFVTYCNISCIIVILQGDIRFVYLLELPRQGDSNKYTKHMIHEG